MIYTSQISSDRSLGPRNMMSSLEKISKSETVYTAQKTRVTRTEVSLIWYCIMLLAFTSVPVFNLYLFYVQPFQLDKNEKNGSVGNKKILQDGANNFNNYYVVIAAYSVITVAFLYNSFKLGKIREMIRMFLHLDGLMLAVLVANLSYVTLHIQYFCGQVLQNSYIVVWQDVAVMVLYSVTNLVMLGKFRSSLLYIRWKYWQVIGIKLFMFGCTTIYFGIALVFMYGLDSGTAKYDSYIQLIALKLLTTYDYIFNYQTDVGQDIQFLFTASYYLNKVQNCIFFYLSTSFNLFFEIIEAISKFDETAKLKTHYTIGLDFQRKLAKFNNPKFKRDP